MRTTTRNVCLLGLGLVATALIKRAYWGSYGAHSKKMLNEGDAHLSTKEEYDRVLGWSVSYSSYYESHCGCTDAMISSIADAQMDAISKLSPFLFYLPMFEPRRELIIEGIARTAEDAAKCFTYDINCGCSSCKNTTDSKEEKSLHYHDCCCDAAIIKDIFISQMDAIRALPDYIILLGESYITSMISAIQTADDGIVESIKDKYICDPTDVPSESPAPSDSLSPSQQPSTMPSTDPSTSQSPTMQNDTLPDTDPMCTNEATQIGENCTNPGMGNGQGNGPKTGESDFVCCEQQGQGNDRFGCWNCNSCVQQVAYHSICCDGGCNATHLNCCKCGPGNSANFECVDAPLGTACSC